MKKFILSTKNISKSYSNLVLNNVSININQGEIYGLIGRNASGKTTLLRIITGLIQKYKGEIIISKNCKMGIIIDSPSLFLNLTAYENIKCQCKLFNIANDELINDLLKTVGLNSGTKIVKEFSLGMMQRLKIAIALINKPNLLILDEPLNGLDPDGISDLRKLILDLNKKYNMTILISSHILSELSKVATKLGILNNGCITKEISKQELEENNLTLENIYRTYTKEVI